MQTERSQSLVAVGLTSWLLVAVAVAARFTVVVAVAVV